MNTYEKVKELAEEKRLTIAAVEREAGLGNAVIAGWKDGNPSVPSLKKIAEYFGVPVEELIGD